MPFFSFRRVRRIRRIRIARPRTIFQTQSKRLYSKYKEHARVVITERVQHFNSYYKLPVGRIAIRNQRSRWGSCSKKGNLNFNYKLALLSSELRDYVIVHEICHIKEFNHGKGFWNLVAETVPQHRELRKKLRTISSGDGEAVISQYM